MENTIRKIFKINIDPIFDPKINSEQREYVYKQIRGSDMFLTKEKTNTRFSENFFMEYDEDYILERLTTLKYPNECFLLKNVAINVGISRDDVKTKLTSFFIDDFYSEVFKEKFKKLFNDLTTLKKESNWSLLSLKDILDVDYRKQAERADTLFIRREYLGALKIYSKFKTEDDFSHYNMEMEIYCRYLTNSNPYSNLIHLTNTNFVNSFYHHRLVIVLLLIKQDDLCYRISRLLNEQYRMFIDLELSKRYLEASYFYRKGLDLLFFCSLYYKGLEFPCDELIDRFINSVNVKEKLLTSPVRYLKQFKGSPEICGKTKNLFDSDTSKSLDKLNEHSFFTFIKYKDDDNSLFLTLNRDLKINTNDKLYILYISDIPSSLRTTFQLNTSNLEINNKNVEISLLLNKHIILEQQNNHFHIEEQSRMFFTFDCLLNNINLEKSKLLWCKEISFIGEGALSLNSLDGFTHEESIPLDISIHITSNLQDSFFINCEHVTYQYQIYKFEITKPKDYEISFDGFTTSSSLMDLKFDRTGVYYKPLSIFAQEKTFTMLIKFTVLSYFILDFSWNKILPSLLTINLLNPTFENTKIAVNRSNDQSISFDGIFKIDAELSNKETNIFDTGRGVFEFFSEIALANETCAQRLKKEVLGIDEPFLEDVCDELPEVNSPVLTSLDFSEHLKKQGDLSINTRGTFPIQFSPNYDGTYNLMIETPKQSFVIPFNVVFHKISTCPFIYILSPGSIHTNTVVKIFCLFNNYFTDEVFIEIDSKTVEIDERDKKTTCAPTKSTVFEIRCKFLFSKKYREDDFRITVSDKNNLFYDYDVLIDLNVV